MRISRTGDQSFFGAINTSMRGWCAGEVALSAMDIQLVDRRHLAL
jgi:hypothetical protein